MMILVLTGVAGMHADQMVIGALSSHDDVCRIDLSKFSACSAGYERF